ncbi:MAG TPA: DUF6705 family protein [Flavobacteriaceae bacterium]|nr:DUF6705 family protein [Flavobacteriaceae bacterium]
MKNLFFILIFFITTYNVNSQVTLVDLDDWNGMPEENHYYKDVDNYLDPFVGTWVYTNGNTSLKIVLEKKVMAANPYYYEDLLVGEYRYVENGVEKINTLPTLTTIYGNQRSHNIVGNTVISKHQKPECGNCTPGEKRVNLGFSDPIHQLSGELILQRITVNGQPALKAYKRTTIYFISMDEKSPYSYMLVPSGEYILMKQ